MEIVVPWPTLIRARNEAEQVARCRKEDWKTDRLAGTLKGKLFGFLMEHKDGWEEAKFAWS